MRLARIDNGRNIFYCLGMSRASLSNARSSALRVQRGGSDGLVLPADASCCRTVGGSRLGRAEAARLSERLKALADPTRLRILSQLLAADEPICACDIGAGFELGQPTISHHLRTLREARLVHAQRRGTWIHYRPDARALAEVREALAAL